MSIAQMQYQYQLIKEAREVVLKFLKNEVGDHLFKPVTVFDNKTIAWMMVHIANTYLFWVGNFSLKQERPFYLAQNFTRLGSLVEIFETTDEMMQRFMLAFDKGLDQQISGFSSKNIPIATNMLAVFTHVITHEFHHKGQIMTMCRLLGHTPPDADVIRF